MLSDESMTLEREYMPASVAFRHILPNIAMRHEVQVLHHILRNHAFLHQFGVRNKTFLGD